MPSCSRPTRHSSPYRLSTWRIYSCCRSSARGEWAIRCSSIALKKHCGAAAGGSSGLCSTGTFTPSTSTSAWEPNTWTTGVLIASTAQAWRASSGRLTRRPPFDTNALRPYPAPDGTPYRSALLHRPDVRRAASEHGTQERIQPCNGAFWRAIAARGYPRGGPGGEGGLASSHFRSQNQGDACNRVRTAHGHRI